MSNVNDQLTKELNTALRELHYRLRALSNEAMSVSIVALPVDSESPIKLHYVSNRERGEMSEILNKMTDMWEREKS